MVGKWLVLMTALPRETGDLSSVNVCVYRHNDPGRVVLAAPGSAAEAPDGTVCMPTLWLNIERFCYPGSGADTHVFRVRDSSEGRNAIIRYGLAEDGIPIALVTLVGPTCLHILFPVTTEDCGYGTAPWDLAVDLYYRGGSAQRQIIPVTVRRISGRGKRISFI